MALPTQFTGNTSPTGEQLDADLAALGALTPIPCSVSGTNDLTLTALANVPTIPAYSNYMQFTGVVAITNTAAMTANVASLGQLNIYKDTYLGPVALTGGEAVAGTKLILMYDKALNGGAGGFHLISPAWPQTRTRTTISSLALAALLPQSGTTATITMGGTSIGDIVSIGFPSTSSIGLVWNGFVPNAGSVVLQVFNTFSAATVTPVPGNYTVLTQGFT